MNPGTDAGKPAPGRKKLRFFEKFNKRRRRRAPLRELRNVRIGEVSLFRPWSFPAAQPVCQYSPPHSHTSPAWFTAGRVVRRCPVRISGAEALRGRRPRGICAAPPVQHVVPPAGQQGPGRIDVFTQLLLQRRHRHKFHLLFLLHVREKFPPLGTLDPRPRSWVVGSNGVCTLLRECVRVCVRVCYVCVRVCVECQTSCAAVSVKKKKSSRKVKREKYCTIFTLTTPLWTLQKC